MKGNRYPTDKLHLFDVVAIQIQPTFIIKSVSVFITLTGEEMMNS